MKKINITKEQIYLSDGSVLDFILDIGKRKNMYINIKEGQVILKIPIGYPKEKAYEFLISKADWIKKSLSKSKLQFGFKNYENGEKIKLLGDEYTLKLLDTKIFFEPYFKDNEIVIPVNENTTIGRIKYFSAKLLSDFAANEIDKAFKKLCKITGLYPTKITIKSMKTRWGSCSSDGHISINFDIIYHERECLEYVIIHELCHLKFMNHSKDFWNLVEKYCPDRKKIRKILNEP